MLKKFFSLNKLLCEKVDRYFITSDDRVLLRRAFATIEPGNKVADVGGGKKPAKFILGIELDEKVVYDGLDISREELDLAADKYSAIYEVDLTDQSFQSPKDYDMVICLNTLEHVKDTKQAIQSLSTMVREGGVVYVKLPCRKAAFARLNKILPNELKRKLMHYVFPSKKGDGFQAYYDHCTPHEITKLAQNSGLSVIDTNYVRYSSYFTFFLPFYVIWRVYTLIQLAFTKDYCESFEMILRKPDF